jgi:hypothetical protein
MTPFPTIIILLLVTAAVSAAGCTGQPAGEKQTADIPVPAIRVMKDPAPASVTTVPTICPVPAAGSYWIRINPVNNVSVGDPIVVKGTTNIPAGMVLNVTVSHYQFRALPHYVPPSVSATVVIQKTDTCINSFSGASNSSGYLGAGEAGAEVYSPDQTLNGHDYPANITMFFVVAR